MLRSGVLAGFLLLTTGPRLAADEQPA